MKVLGLINARGGSKGVPRKNIKNLLGKPLIAYSIEAGLHATTIDRVVVSTDDLEIAETAIQFGADVPFMRPQQLALDTTLQIDVIKHALLTLRARGEEYDIVVLLQPTCPLRTFEDVDGAMNLMLSSGADTVISVSEVQGQHPLTMYAESSSKTLEPVLKSNLAGVLRQSLPKIWWRNGAIYIVRSQVILDSNSLYGPVIVGYHMPPERSANIDEPIDWVITEALFKYNKGI